MRHTPGRAILAAMKITPRKQCVTLDAAIDRSVIHGTLTAASGARRDFHGWLELNTALEAILDARADRAPYDNPAASAAVPANVRATRPTAPATKSVNPRGGRSGTQARAAGDKETDAKLS
jgi:hypothetical protein